MGSFKTHKGRVHFAIIEKCRSSSFFFYTHFFNVNEKLPERRDTDKEFFSVVDRARKEGKSLMLDKRRISNLNWN